MSHVELLRASSLKAEAQYRQEVSSLRSLRQEETKERHRTTETRKEFWKHATAAASPKSRVSAEHSPLAPTERMWRAHESLKHATAKHGDLVGKLKTGAERLASAQERIDVLQKMIASLDRQRAHRLENQSSDELGDLLASLVKTKLSGRSDREREAERVEVVGQAQPLFRNGTLDAAPPVDVSALRQAHEPLSAADGARDQLLAIQKVSSEIQESQKSLTVDCSLGARGSVSVALVKRDGESIKALISPEGNQLALSIQRDKALVLSRLQAMGLRVGSLSVGDDSSVAPSDRGGQRMKRRSREEDDESRIA